MSVETKNGWIFAVRQLEEAVVSRNEDGIRDLPTLSEAPNLAEIGEALRAVIGVLQGSGQ